MVMSMERRAEKMKAGEINWKPIVTVEAEMKQMWTEVVVGSMSVAQGTAGCIAMFT